MTGPRILILSASVGSGHGRAAQAIELRWPNGARKRTSRILMCSSWPMRCSGGSTAGVLRRHRESAAPVGYLYDRLDQPLREWEKPLDRARYGLQGLNLRRLTGLLTSRKWDLAICTHFLPAEVISRLRRAGQIDVPQVTVTTDFDTHRLWHNDPCEHYFTATEEGRRNLSARGVPAHRITASGIPIHPLFARPADAWGSAGSVMGCSMTGPWSFSFPAGLESSPREASS